MRDYRDKTVKGMVADVKNMIPKKTNVRVQMTADKHGQSLSLSTTDVLIMIPLESVRDIIRVVKESEKIQ